MKAVAFEYVRAESLDEACRLLAGSGERKIIAGGQTLVPLMAMRLARPDMLVDINDLHELRGIRDLGDAVAVGVVTRQRDVERSDLVTRKLPLLAKAILHVAISKPAIAAPSAAASRTATRRRRFRSSLSRWTRS